MTLPLNRLQQLLKQKRLDAIFISNPANVSYISGFKGSGSFLFIFKDRRPIFITDFRYLQQAENEIKNYEVLCLKTPIFDKIPQIAKKYRLKKIGFESAHLSFKRAKALNLKAKNIFSPTDNLIEGLRIVKEKAEIESIKKAARIAVDAVKKATAYIKPGTSELDVAGYIEWCMRKEGAEKIAFPSIVASGKNSSMPHAVSSLKKIKGADVIIIDCGCCFNGYNSDLTRTIFLGKIDAQFKYMYNTIKDAHDKAISIIRPGIKISSIDRVARGHISKKGLGKYFGHATGHGIGLEVHEAPRISGKNNKTLKEGMVFTVEPGAYVPGLGGVRIEDMIVVTDKSYNILT